MSVITMAHIDAAARNHMAHNLAVAHELGISVASMGWALQNASHNSVYGLVFKNLNNKNFATASAWQTLADIDDAVFAKDVICDLVDGLDKTAYTNVTDLFSDQTRVNLITADPIAVKAIYLSDTALTALLASGWWSAKVIGIALVNNGGGAGEWQRVDFEGNNLTGTEYNFGNSYYTSHPCYNLSEVTYDGQNLISIPKTYVKTGVGPSGSDQEGKQIFWVCDKPAAGFHLHPAFMLGGSEIDQFYWGAYKAGVDSGKLTSVAGVACRVSAAQSVFEDEADARNVPGVTGFRLTSYHELCIIQRLLLIELGSPDVQALIHAGHTAGSSQVATNHASELGASWRGLNGLWGNVLQLMVGWQNDVVDDVQTIRLWDRDGNQTFVNAGTNDNLTAAWRYATGLNGGSGTGYDHTDGFLPSATDATSTNGMLASGYYGSTGLRRYDHGGNWGSGADAGVFCVSAHFAPSISSTSSGCRLARVV